MSESKQARLIVSIVRKVLAVYTVHRWEHLARKAMRNLEYCVAEAAMARADELRNKP